MAQKQRTRRLRRDLFRLQKNLPYMKILIITGIMIAVVLLQIVGSTTHVMQVVGWLPIHIIQGLELPYWLGTWFGVYVTWEGLVLQLAAAIFCHWELLSCRRDEETQNILDQATNGQIYS